MPRPLTIMKIPKSIHKQKTFVAASSSRRKMGVAEHVDKYVERRSSSLLGMETVISVYCHLWVGLRIVKNEKVNNRHVVVVNISQNDQDWIERRTGLTMQQVIAAWKRLNRTRPSPFRKLLRVAMIRELDELSMIKHMVQPSMITEEERIYFVDEALALDKLGRND